VVIPLSRLADYSEGIERINIEHALSNKLLMLEEVRRLLQGDEAVTLVANPSEDSDETRKIVRDRLDAAAADLKDLQQRWSELYEKLQSSDDAFLLALREGRVPVESDSCIEDLLRRDDVISYRASVEKPLKERFSGNRYERLRQRIEVTGIYTRISRSTLTTM